MKTPLYETTPGATAALLATRSFVYCDLYTFTLFGGGVLTYATSDQSVAYNGNTWSAAGTLFDTAGSSAKAHWKIGMDVDSWNVALFPRAADPLTGAAYPDQIGAQPFLAAVRAGALDGATVQIDRAYFAAWPPYTGRPMAPTGVITVFAGIVAEGDGGRDGNSLVINSHMERFGNPLPRNLYQASCRFTLFDTQCGLIAGTYAVKGTMTTSATGSSLPIAVAAPGGSGTYTLGRLAFTSGQNAGITRMIRQWTAGVSLNLMSPFPYAIATGDAYTLWPGCDKTMATCTAFGNLPAFGGMPFIPAPEAAV